MVTDLETFGNHVTEAMWKHLIDLYGQEESIATDPVAATRSYHEGFIENHSRHFVGRQTILNSITKYVLSDDSKPLMILGEPGSGINLINLH